MSDQNSERRKHKRYNTDVKIHFEFAYDLETKVKFAFIQAEKKISKKYSAVSRNISAQGLCFVSHKEVKQNDLLNLEVFLPSAKNPIPMKGQAKWCKPSESAFDYGLEGKKGQTVYDVGVELKTVNKDAVPESVYFDEEYGVQWSAVLECVFGSYKMLMGEKYKRKKKK